MKMRHAAKLGSTPLARRSPARLFAAALAVSLVLAVSGASAVQDSPVGRWTTIDDETGEVKSVVEIWQDDGVLSGKINKLVVGPTEDPNPLCESCKEERHNQPVVGMKILWDLVRDGDHWDGGKVLDPGNGSTYRCSLSLIEGGAALDVRGYIGFSLFGRTQRWIREE